MTCHPWAASLARQRDGPPDGRGAVCGWQTSTRELVHAGTYRRRELAERRRAYLDEMERRHPGRFQSWLEQTGGADQELERFLIRD